MRRCFFTVIDYAQDDTSFESWPLLVIRKDLVPHQVKAFLLADWQSALAVQDPATQYIEDFLYDVRMLSFKSEDEVTGFLQTADTFSVGPLRTTHSGICELIPHVDLSTLEEHAITTCSAEVLSQMIRNIRRFSDKYSSLQSFLESPLC